MPEESVIKYLLTDAGIYPYARPQGSALPAVTVHRNSGGPTYADDGEVGLFHIVMKVTSFGDTYGAAKDLAEIVFSKLSAVRDLNYYGITFRYITLNTEQDGREGGSNSYRYEFSVEQDYAIWYELSATITGILAATVPTVTLSAQGTVVSGDITGALAATVPTVTLSAQGEVADFGTLAATVPTVTLSAQATVGDLGVLAAIVPTVTLSAQGEASTIGQLAATVPTVTLSAQGEVADFGTLAATVPTVTLSAQATVGDLGVLAATVPTVTLSATGAIDIVGEMTATVPTVTLAATGTATTAGYPADVLSNVAAAYSTRRLLTSYSGSAIRVRRSSDSTEQDIGFSGGDLDTTALAAFVGAGDGYLITWYDQSGNSRNATVISGALPRIVIGGTIQTVNGHAAAVAGSLSASLHASAGGTISSANAEIFQTFSHSADGGYQRFMTVHGNGVPDWDNDAGFASNATPDGTTISSYRNYDGVTVASTAGTVHTTYHKATSDGELVYNGTSTQSNTGRGHGDLAITGIGLGTENGSSGNMTIGYLCEAVLTTSIQTDYTTFYDDQATYWGVI